jgi:type I restriction enzyme S subunit
MDYVMLTPQVTSYRVINEDILSRDFLFHFFQSNFLQDQLYEMAKGGSTRAYAGITKQNSLIIKVPPISIQNELIYIFEKMETLKKSLLNSFSEKIRLLPILKQSILQQAFNGELVKD